jgi:L-rhamnose mutarotase
VRRFGQVLRVRPEHRDEYVRLHAAVWPEVLQTIRHCNIRNYSIFLRGEWLFAYFEYVGDDFDADMRKMADNPKTQEWWALMEPMQDPLPDRREGEWWATMDEVFHTD